MVIKCNGYIGRYSTFAMIIKNLNADKPPTCTACRKVIAYREKYFTLPSSFQRYCLKCAQVEVPKLVELLNKDLQALQQDQS